MRLTQVGGAVARKLKGEMQTSFTESAVDYTVGLQVTDPFLGYVHENEEYFADPQQVPFETKYFPDELGSGKWKKQKKWATKRDVKQVKDQVNNLHTKREAIEWRSGLHVTDELQLYVHDGVEYLPDSGAVPFTTGSSFDAGQWVQSGLAKMSDVYDVNNSIYKYRHLAKGKDWTAAFNQAWIDNDTVDVGNLVCRVTNLSMPVGKVMRTTKRASILIDNSTLNIIDPNRAFTDVVRVQSSLLDVLPLVDASKFNVGDLVIIGYRNLTGEQPIIDQSFDADEWGYNSQLTKIVAKNGNNVTIQDKTMFPIPTNRPAFLINIPNVETVFDGDITFTRNSDNKMFTCQSRTIFKNKITIDGTGGTGNMIAMDTRALCELIDLRIKGFNGGGAAISLGYGALHNTITRIQAHDYTGTDALIMLFNGSNNNVIDSPNMLTHSNSATGTYGGVSFHAKAWGNTLIGGRLSGGTRGLSMFYGAHDNVVIGTHFSNHSNADVFAFDVDGGAKFTMCTFSSAINGFNHVYADNSKNIDFNMCKFNGVGVKTLALEWRKRTLDATCCFTYTACEFVNSQFYLNFSADGLGWDNCEFTFTPDVGYNYAIKTYRADGNTYFEGWNITNTKFNLCYLDFSGLQYSRIMNGNEFDGGNAATSGAAIRLSNAGVCNEIAFNTFRNYDAHVSIGSLQAATASVHDNITINVTQGDKCMGANATNDRPSPQVALTANWKVYPQKVDPTQNRTVNYYRARANGAIDHTQFATVAISES